MNDQFECATWRQGDVFFEVPSAVFDSGWRPVATEADEVVVVSQSCDAALAHRPLVQVAPIVTREGAHAREAASGRQPQYAAIPGRGDSAFADLDRVVTVHKGALSANAREPGLRTDQEVREFAFSVARKFGRFAFPDEVVELLRPVTEAIRSKARKSASPVGKVMAHVHSIRISCSDWANRPYQLTLMAVLERGVLPIEIEEFVQSPEIESVLCLGDDVDAQITACVKAINGPVDAATRYFAWNGLVEGWAAQCTAVAGGIAVVASELSAVDEFPLSRVLQSEQLDLDYLSDSRRPPS